MYCMYYHIYANHAYRQVFLSVDGAEDGTDDDLVHFMNHGLS